MICMNPRSLGKNSEGLLSSYTDFFLDVVKSTPRVKASTLKCAVMLCFDKITAETGKNFANKVSQAHQYVVAKSKSFVNGARLSTSTRGGAGIPAAQESVGGPAASDAHCQAAFSPEEAQDTGEG